MIEKSYSLPVRNK